METSVIKLSLSNPGYETSGSISCYGRWTKAFKLEIGIDHVLFTAPDGIVYDVPAFEHQPAEFHYDYHGYERLVSVGNPVTAVRYTPDREGVYLFCAMKGNEISEKGQFTCEPSHNNGYIEVSKKDPRYFAYTDGTSFCPIGLNLCWPPYYRLPSGHEHFATSGENATMGSAEYRRWFKELSQNGGNFARLWLALGYLKVEGDIAGNVDLAAFNRLDAVVEAARAYGIKLKLCFEFFRNVGEDKNFAKTIKHPADGRSPRNMNEWFESDIWQELWMKKVKAYIARYGNDPTVMAWELWNEINCCSTDDWNVQYNWTKNTLPKIKAMAPKQLVVNSLGSFDWEGNTRFYNDFQMDEMDFQQVHRYLDQGASLEICTKDPAEFSVDAVKRTRRADKPVLLAETGAVNDAHTGPFRFYRFDNRGIIFHDTTFPAFFGGAAGTGHIWHWDEYVDEKNLWKGFLPFSQMIEGIRLDEENFESLDLSNEDIRFYVLKGSKHYLGWLRSRSDSWYSVLRDGVEPGLISDQIFHLDLSPARTGRLEVFKSWEEEPGSMELIGDKLRVIDMKYGFMFKIQFE